MVQGPKMPGEAATLGKDSFETKIKIPEGTEIRVTYRADAVFYEFKLDQASEFISQAEMLRASTGKIDTELAKHESDNKARQILLYGALVAGLAAAVAVWRGWPTLAIILGIAAGACLFMWKMTELPAWIWAVVGLPLAAAGVWWGYTRAQKQVDPTNE